MDSVAIIGGGIGGLTLAAYLDQAGLPVRVFERAPALGEVGAGLGLWSNATYGLQQIGIEDSYWGTVGCEVHRVELGTPAGKSLSRCDVRGLRDRLATRNYVVHRADLHAAIAAKVSPSVITTGKETVGVEERSDVAVATFADGSEVEAGLIVGADGLHSVVRSELFGKRKPSYSGQVCYRGIVDVKVEERNVLREVQGRGLRCSVIPLNENRVYWWVTEKWPEGQDEDPIQRKDRLRHLFKDWKFGFPEALEATDPASILKNDLYDRPPIQNWSRGRIGLLGDAAHPTTPNLGQGACLAIEDAVDLGNRIVTYGLNSDRIFREYEMARRKRAYSIVKQSRRLGWMGSWENSAAVRFREILLFSIPDGMMERQLMSQIGFEVV